MVVPRAIGSIVEQRLGESIAMATSVSGGDINAAYRVVLGGGDVVFVKTNERAPADMFEREASGLEWLAEAGAIRVPRVLAHTTTALALEWIERGTAGPRYEEELGRGLARLHRAGPGRFGLDHDNYVGTIAQSNASLDDWASFYRERRLRPTFRRCAHLFDASLTRRFETLLERLDRLVGPSEPPSRLHGDLWSGNVMVDGSGLPVLVDPAVYGGHREIDLAMMRLFGHLPERALRAYEEIHPLAPGHEDRVALYQLYPLLVHVCLFGRGYVSSVARAVEAYVP